jgi:hypothetical protein
MPEYTVALSCLLQQPSPLQQTRRNIQISAGDDFIVVVTAYADEDAAAPASIAGSVPTLYLYGANYRGWDYGLGAVGQREAILQIAGTLGAAGQMTFVFSPALTSGLRGRFVFVIRLVTALGAGAVVMRGALEVARSIYFPVLGPGGDFILDISFLDGPDVME